jgi:hypothetical protein
VLASLAAFAGQAAVVYKWTDSDGVVHYSDQPVPGAQKIFTASSSITGSSSAETPSEPGPATPKQASGPLGFAEFSISTPAANQTFFGDDVVSVHLNIEPGLRPNQNITWHLNGKQLDEQGMQFTLPHMDRGAYVLAATVTDQATGESRTSDSVTFFVRQPSELSPQHKNP